MTRASESNIDSGSRGLVTFVIRHNDDNNHYDYEAWRGGVEGGRKPNSQLHSRQNVQKKQHIHPREREKKIHTNTPFQEITLSLIRIKTLG